MKKCVGVLVYLCVLVTVKCKLNLAYNGKVGIAVERLCLNNCVNDQCVVYNTGDVDQCYNTEKDAPVFQLTQKKANCLSRCVEKSSYWSSWCYTDNDGNYEYCNRNQTVEWIRGQKFTISNGPCKDECRFYYTDSNNKNWYSCNNYWGGLNGWDYCEPKFNYDYIQAQTASGEFCRGKCKDHDHNGKRWCYYGDRKWDYCALPALPRPRDWSKDLEELFMYRTPFNVSYSIERCKREIEEDTPEYRVGLRTENLNNLAVDLEQDQQYDYVYINPEDRDPNEPIYSWTMETGDVSRNIPVIPRVVRAELFPRHLRPTSERGSIPKLVYDNLKLMGKLAGDHAGHLIAYTLHGPDELHNFVPQMGRLNQGDYASQEQKIRKFLRDHQDGKIDMLVIPLYREGETRPRGIAMHVRYFRGNTLVDQYYEYLPNYPDYGMRTTLGPFSTPPPPGPGFNSILHPSFGLAGCR